MANEKVSEVCEREFSEKLNKNKFLVADFFADWCMPCLMMAPILETLATKYEKANFLKVNVEDCQNLAQQLDVSALPTLIFFKDGKEFDRLSGVVPEDFIEEKIKVLVKNV